MWKWITTQFIINYRVKFPVPQFQTTLPVPDKTQKSRTSDICDFYYKYLINQHVQLCSLSVPILSFTSYTLLSFITMVKVKVTLSLCFNWAPRHEGVLGEWRYSSTHSLTSALDGGEWLTSRPGRFTHRERATCTHWIRGWVGPRAILDAVVKRKVLSPRRVSNPRTPIIQPVAQRYTDWAITALFITINNSKYRLGATRMLLSYILQNYDLKEYCIYRVITAANLRTL
jgi:hypothetical protein